MTVDFDRGSDDIICQVVRYGLQRKRFIDNSLGRHDLHTILHQAHHPAVNPVLQYGHVKIDQKPKLTVRETQIRQQLRLMDRMQEVHRFQFDD